jgi:type II secretory pathway component PulL
VLISSAVAARWSNRWSERNLGIGFAGLVLAMSVLTVVQASGA